MHSQGTPVIEMHQPPGTLASFAAILNASRKRPGAVTALAPVCWVRPSVTLSASDIAAFAKVCGYQQGHGVPLLYPQMLTFPLAMAYFASAHCPWPALGTVHLANRVRQHAALKAGDVLRVEMRPGDLQAHDKGQIFSLEFQIFKGTQLVWEATQTLLRMGVANPSGKPYASALHNDQPLSLQTNWMADGGIGRRYGRVSGDLNPIHLSALSARLFGFRRAIAHGMWTKARALAAMLPTQPLAQAEVQVEFKTPLFLPARATLWSTRAVHGPLSNNALFDVRNAKGDKPHLRASLSYTLA
jgi:acyl dehydratase